MDNAFSDGFVNNTAGFSQEDFGLIRTACIHCFNCVFACPRQAIAPRGDKEAAKGFIENMLRHGNEAPLSAVYS